MSTFLNEQVTGEQATLINEAMASRLNPPSVPPVSNSDLVRDAVDKMRRAGLGARETVCTLILSGAMDAYLDWAQSSPESDSTVEEPTILPIIPAASQANSEISCVDCNSRACSYQFSHEEDGVRVPIPAAGMCLSCYMAFTLDVTRDESEVEELNADLIPVGA